MLVQRATYQVYYSKGRFRCLTIEEGDGCGLWLVGVPYTGSILGGNCWAKVWMGGWNVIMCVVSRTGLGQLT